MQLLFQCVSTPAWASSEIDAVPATLSPGVTAATPSDKVIILTERVNQLMSRVNELENEVTRLKSDTGKKSSKSAGTSHKTAPPAHSPPKMETVKVTPPISDETILAPVNEDAILVFRKAYALYQTAKYPEAILEWTRFQKDYPDHVLAGSAQFYLGDSYFKQNEYKLAAGEFQKVLLTYDRSSHVSDTLDRLAHCADKNGDSVQASKHKQMLKGLFGHSPSGLIMTSGNPTSVSTHPSTPTSTTTAKNHLDAPPGDVPPTAPMAAPSKPKEIEPEEEEEPQEIND